MRPAEAAVTIGGKTLTLGMMKDDLIALFGQPQRINKIQTEKGMQEYVYNADYQNFFIARICAHGRVVNLYTNASSFRFNNKGFGSYVYSSGYYHSIINKASSNIGIVRWEPDKYHAGKLYGIELNSYCPEEHYTTPSVDYDYAKLALEWERNIFDMTNAFRVSHGMAALQWHDELATVVREFSLDLSRQKDAGHYDSLGRSPFDRMKDAGIQYRSAGENSGYLSYGDYVTFFDGWVNSANHRKNLIDPQWTHLAVGYTIIHDSTLGQLRFGVQNFIAK